MIRWQISIAVYSVIISGIYSANIIALFPIEAKSHARFNDIIVKELINAGHDVTYVTSMPPSESFPNCTVIDFRFGVERKTVPLPLNWTTQPWYYSKKQTLDEFEKIFCYSSIRKTLDHLKISKKQFDLLMVHAAILVHCLMPIAQEFDIPIIGTVTTRSSEYADRLMGNIRNPATTLTDFIDFYDVHTFWYRLINSFNQLAQFILFSSYESTLEDPRFGRHFPHFIKNEKSKLSLVFCNNHLSLLPRPLAPSFIDIAGLHISPAPSALPQQIKTFIEDASKGVILFSLGSLMESSKLFADTNLLNVFSQLPERVIWKTSEKIQNLPENVLTLKWLPQRDILAHENVKAFITHCGLFGTQETIFEGKPVVMIPFHSDQAGNAILMHEKGVGIHLEEQTLTEHKLLKAIRSVIDDNKYRENMQNLSLIFKDRILSPQKTLIYWTEYVIRHKGALHLRTAAADMPYYQYFLLDVLIFMIFVSVVSFSVFLIFVKKLYQVFWTNLSEKKSN